MALTTHNAILQTAHRAFQYIPSLTDTIVLIPLPGLVEAQLVTSYATFAKQISQQVRQAYNMHFSKFSITLSVTFLRLSPRPTHVVFRVPKNKIKIKKYLKNALK